MSINRKNILAGAVVFLHGVVQTAQRPGDRLRDRDQDHAHQNGEHSQDQIKIEERTVGLSNQHPVVHQVVHDPVSIGKLVKHDKLFFSVQTKGSAAMALPCVKLCTNPVGQRLRLLRGKQLLIRV